MQRKAYLTLGSLLIVTIMFVIAFITFSALGITSADIRQNNLTIVSESVEKIYDGKSLSHNEWYIESGNLQDNHEIKVIMPTEITNPGVKDNEIGVTISDELGNNVTGNYNITFNLGTLEVYRRTIKVGSENLSKTYDGTALESEGWFIQSGSIARDHAIEYSMPSSIETPGTTDNEIYITIYDQQNRDVSENYEIDFDFGELSINYRSLKIGTETHSKIYDSTPLESNSWYIKSGTVISNHHIEYFMPSSITNPGTVDNDISFTVFDNNNEDVTEHYNITFDLGLLTVNRRDIEIRTESAKKMYDGSPLKYDSWHHFSGSLLKNHHIEYVMPSSISTPKTILNEIDLIILDENNENMTNKYDINYKLGNLTIDPIPIILQSASDNKIYDGEPLLKDEWELVYGGILEDHDLHVVVDGEITNVGTIDNNIFAYVTDKDDNNVNSYYDFDYFKGKLTVLSSVYSSDDISRESFEIDPQDVFQFFSSDSESIYFRGTSLGEYNKSGWNAGVNHNLNLNSNPLNFSAKALMDSGYEPSVVEIEYLREQMPYLLPYFNVDILSDTNDIFISGDQSEIISFNFIPSFDELNTLSLEDTLYYEDELAYQSFVYENYLSIPSSTYNEMTHLADENNLDASSETIIHDVQQYIQNAATYTTEFETIPQEVDDIAIYFLTVSQEGICQHFATAATLMYRSLGIPARYVTGFLGIGEADEWTTVTQEYAHAWVEIYIDGVGWIPIEVTGSIPAGDLDLGDCCDDNHGGNDEEDNGEEDNGDDILGEITVRPRNVRIKYNSNQVIKPDEAVIMGFDIFKDNGFTYDVTYEGKLSSPGIEESSISTVIIYDEKGVDVTNRFDINLKSGILQLYIHKLELFTTTVEKVYDGRPIQGDNYHINGLLESSHDIENIEFQNNQVNVGYSKNSAVLTIYDEYGSDVSDLYYVQSNFGDLIVHPRELSIESASDEKTFDGTPLVNQNYTITDGSLAVGETLDITIEGSQTFIGKSVNNIESVYIYNNGENVIYNYIIKTEEGELVVRPN